ncbi:MAG: SurA N-terminal domain-containing protein, partial [Gammaproteobacteria bacterium]
MLQFFRDKLRGVIVWIIVSAIILAFILSAASYLFNMSYNNTLVKVDGESIDLNIVNQHYQRELQQNYSKKHNLDLDSKKLKQNILNDLINQVAVIKG